MYPHNAAFERSVYLKKRLGEDLIEFLENYADRVWEESEMAHYGFDVSVYAEFDQQKYAIFLQIKYPYVKWVDLNQPKNESEPT